MWERRLRMSHSVMEMRHRIAINDNKWTDGERENILKRATELYLLKNSKHKLDNGISISKKPKLEKEEETEESSAEEKSDNDCTFFIILNYFRTLTIFKTKNCKNLFSAQRKYVHFDNDDIEVNDAILSFLDRR